MDNRVGEVYPLCPAPSFLFILSIVSFLLFHFYCFRFKLAYWKTNVPQRSNRLLCGTRNILSYFMNISLAYCSCNLPSQNGAGVSFRHRLLMLVIFPFFKDTHGYTIMFAHAFYFFFRHGTLLLHPLLKPSGIIAEKYRSFLDWSCHNCFPFFWLQGQRYAQFLVAQGNAVESFSFSNMSKNASFSQSSLFGDSGL